MLKMNISINLKEKLRTRMHKRLRQSRRMIKSMKIGNKIKRRELMIQIRKSKN
jgi:hypothetical protein